MESDYSRLASVMFLRLAILCVKETLKDKRETWSGQMYVSVRLVGLVGSLVGWFGLFVFFKLWFTFLVMV